MFKFFKTLYLLTTNNYEISGMTLQYIGFLEKYGYCLNDDEIVDLIFKDDPEHVNKCKENWIKKKKLLYPIVINKFYIFIEKFKFVYNFYC